MTDQRIDVFTLPDSQLRAAVHDYGKDSMRGALAAEVLRLRGVLAVIEGALSVTNPTQPNEPGRDQRALMTVRAALNMVDR